MGKSKIKSIGVDIGGIKIAIAAVENILLEKFFANMMGFEKIGTKTVC